MPGSGGGEGRDPNLDGILWTWHGASPTPSDWFRRCRVGKTWTHTWPRRSCDTRRPRTWPPGSHAATPRANWRKTTRRSGENSATCDGRTTRRLRIGSVEARAEATASCTWRCIDWNEWWDIGGARTTCHVADTTGSVGPTTGSSANTSTTKDVPSPLQTCATSNACSTWTQGTSRCAPKVHERKERHLQRAVQLLLLHVCVPMAPRLLQRTIISNAKCCVSWMEQ